MSSYGRMGVYRVRHMYSAAVYEIIVPFGVMANATDSDKRFATSQRSIVEAFHLATGQPDDIVTFDELIFEGKPRTATEDEISSENWKSLWTDPKATLGTVQSWQLLD